MAVEQVGLRHLEAEGVVLVPGQRPGSETVDGTVNMLCSDRLTDIGEGACYQSTFLDVEAWDETAGR